MRALIVTADDYGYHPAYDAGIVAAAGAAGIDAVSAMVGRRVEPGPLAASAVAVGLHLELDPHAAAGPGLQLERQLERFAELFGRQPSHLDGHHHCHAAPGPVALAIAQLAAERRLPTRAVNARHRRLLDRLGVPTAGRLIGRWSETDAVVPGELAEWLAGRPPAVAVTEWAVHPGLAGGCSSYDRGRPRDLALLLELGDPGRWAKRGIRRVGPSEL